MRMSTAKEKIRVALMQYGVCTAAQLQADAGVNQSTVSRALAGISDSVLTIGRGRATRYGWLTDIEELGNHWPLYTISEEGLPVQVGRMHSLASGHWYLEGGGRGPWHRLFDGGEEVFPDLPWFLEDIRPQGFLGRCFARSHAGDLGASPDPTTWPGRVVVEAALRFGSDLPGSFVIGREALKAALNEEGVIKIPASERKRAYPRMVETVLKGKMIGSSAGGEQPKFTLVVDGTHVLVKFSPKIRTPVGERWADLLACEYIANRVLSQAGVEVPDAKILDAEGARFLQVERFDRTALGRRTVVSLLALDANFVGEPHTDWSYLAGKLHGQKLIEEDTLRQIQFLDEFGEMIGNTDRHFGNLSFYLPPSGPLPLTPVYDMLPMVFRPDRDGVPPAWDSWQVAFSGRSGEAVEWAKEFWRQVSQSELVTGELRRRADAFLSEG